MRTPWHNPAAELDTLYSELAHAKRRLTSCEQEAAPVIRKHIAQINRDIRRNTARLMEIT